MRKAVTEKHSKAQKAFTDAPLVGNLFLSDSFLPLLPASVGTPKSPVLTTRGFTFGASAQAIVVAVIASTLSSANPDSIYPHGEVKTDIFPLFINALRLIIRG